MIPFWHTSHSWHSVFLLEAQISHRCTVPGSDLFPVAHTLLLSPPSLIGLPRLHKKFSQDEEFTGSESTWTSDSQTSTYHKSILLKWKFGCSRPGAGWDYAFLTASQVMLIWLVCSQVHHSTPSSPTFQDDIAWVETWGKPGGNHWFHLIRAYLKWQIFQSSTEGSNKPGRGQMMKPLLFRNPLYFPTKLLSSNTQLLSSW